MFKNSKHYPILVVALLWVVALLNYMDRQMLSTMQSSICTDIVELQEAEAFGALMAIFLWIYGFMSPVAGLIADRLSRKWLVVASLFVWSAVTFLMGYAENFNQLYWLRAIMGVSEALYIPSALSLIADWHEGKSRSLAIGVHTTGLYIGQAIGGFGATAATFFSWQGTFQGFGMVGIVYSLILILLLHENPKHDIRSATASKNGTTGFAAGDILKSLALVFSNFAFWVILIYFAVPSLPGWATKNWLPTLFAESLNIPMSEAGPISTIPIAASSFVGVLFGGYLRDRWVQRNIRGRIYTGASGLGLTIPAQCLLGMGHDLFSFVSAVLLFGIGFGMFDANNMPILCQFIAAKYRATAYGIMNMVGVFFGAAVTQVLGRWTDAGNLGSGFVLLGGAVAVALILQLACLKPQTDNKE